MAHRQTVSRTAWDVAAPSPGESPWPGRSRYTRCASKGGCESSGGREPAHAHHRQAYDRRSASTCVISCQAHGRSGGGLVHRSSDRLDRGDGVVCTHDVLEPVDLSEHDPLPLACTLQRQDGPARLLRWQRLHAQAAPFADLQDGYLEVRYRPGPGVLEELIELAAAEQECCSFVAWSVEVVEGLPVLRVTAPPGTPYAVVPSAALFTASGSSSVASQ